MRHPGSSIAAIRLTVLDIQRSLQPIEGLKLRPQSNFWTLRGSSNWVSQRLPNKVAMGNGLGALFAGSGAEWARFMGISHR